MEEFNERLKQMRLQKNVSQTQVALATNISKDLYNKYERTTVRPSYENLVKLAEYFGTTTDDLIGFCAKSSERVDQLRCALKESGYDQKIDRMSDARFAELVRTTAILIDGLLNKED